MQELRNGIKIPIFLRFLMLESEQHKQDSKEEKVSLDKNLVHPIQFKNIDTKTDMINIPRMMNLKSKQTIY